MGKNKTPKGMYVSFLSACLFIFLLNQTIQSQELTIEQIAENALPAVVRIDTYDITGEYSGTGTGFFLKPGRILTCAHCLEDTHSARISQKEGEYIWDSFDLKKILKMNKELDLALLEVECPVRKILYIENNEKIRVGQKIVTIGFSACYYKSVTDGIISQIMTEGYPDDEISLDDVYRIQFTAPISEGNSGGPLLNTKGHVIGIVSSSYPDGEDINFAVGIGNISKFLDAPDNPTQLPKVGSYFFLRKVTEHVGKLISKIFKAIFSASEWTFFLILKIISVILVVVIAFVVMILTFRLLNRIFSFSKITRFRKNPIQVLHGFALLMSCVSVIMVLEVYFSWPWLILSLTFLPLALVLTLLRYTTEKGNK